MGPLGLSSWGGRRLGGPLKGTGDPGGLSSWARRRLEAQLKGRGDARVSRRTLAVLEVASGEPVALVADRLRVTPRSVYNWVAAYTHSRDPDCLRDRDRPGRPTLL